MTSKNNKICSETIPLKDTLERIYFLFNKRKYIDPDPLLFLYDYEAPEDIEIVAFIASSLAYGRVGQILKSVRAVLAPMGQNPADFIRSQKPEMYAKYYCGFKHRFNDGADIMCLFTGMRVTLENYGSLENAFLDGLSPEDDNIIPATELFSKKLCDCFPGKSSFLLPYPSKGSACKRLFLALRWLVRKDNVDIGVWTGIPKEKLIVPLDTHMFRICGSLGLTKRKNADICSALEITNAFRLIAPEDPVKYDFSLTRFGIHPEIREIPLKIL